MVNLYLIRHGRQNSSLCNVDVELSTEGRAQAEQLRERLTRYNIDALYSSNLIRAVETAKIINQSLHLPHMIKEELREISFGFMEGKSDEYNNEHYKDFKEEQYKLLEDIPYPGGENGTSVYERAMPVIQELVQGDKKNIVVVTHGGTIRVLLAALFGKNQAKRFLFGVSLENTSITQLVYHPDYDRFYLERFNDFAHLESHPKLLRRNW
ncbi:histidine phosphatase family protein [Mobilitalea sibirica]|uniref:Histidine phosphatase family protein n=1 Tax=Mobilitalea sibirica TaxID=1462919 RepID=A0A8J7HCM9_9FIRM|nr:histidine phosphatase family protein [Mobilitalea sibirica]MBH1942251.1 histidine phosphatase family protein [Mobilitalea sibirica]